MRCERAFRWIERHCDPAALGRRGEPYLAHLRTCADCAAFARGLGRGLELLLVATPAPPTRLMRRVVKTLQASRKRRKAGGGAA